MNFWTSSRNCTAIVRKMKQFASVIISYSTSLMYWVRKDALSFHQRMNLVDPVEKLAAGPVHFAYTGWANVEILPESNPSPDENYFLKFYHHNSFEAQSWKKVGRKSDIPVCTMSCGYSSGWCEESFGLALTTVELECEATGAERCLFIMAPPEKIKEYLTVNQKGKTTEQFDVPVFFEKKVCRRSPESFSGTKGNTCYKKCIIG